MANRFAAPGTMTRDAGETLDPGSRHLQRGFLHHFGQKVSGFGFSPEGNLKEFEDVPGLDTARLRWRPMAGESAGGSHGWDG